MSAFSDAYDRELHEMLRNGNKAALADLFKRCAPMVFGVALQVTGNRVAAEKVARAVFVELWRRPECYDPTRGSIRPWLATMTHLRSVDWVRSHVVRQRWEQNSVDAGMDDLPSVDETVASTIEAERVERALEGLCETERTPINLAYFGNRTYRQVAEDLEVAEATIKSRIRTGLCNLAVALCPEALDTAI